MESGTESRRRAKRIYQPFEVQCSGVGGTRISDLSATGAFIDTLTELPKGSTLSMKFTLESTEINVDAQVVHCMRSIGMGVRFLNLEPHHQAAIERIVNRQDL